MREKIVSGKSMRGFGGRNCEIVKGVGSGVIMLSLKSIKVKGGWELNKMSNVREKFENLKGGWEQSAKHPRDVKFCANA